MDHNAATVIRPTYVTADTIPNAWLNAMSVCLIMVYKSDVVLEPDTGMKRHEVGFTTLGIKTPGAKPLIPELKDSNFKPVPGGVEQLEDYVLALLTGRGQGEDAQLCGKRMCKVAVPIGVDPETHRPELDNVWLTDNVLKSDGHWLEDPLMNQVEALIWMYKNKGHHLSDMTLQIGSPLDLALKKSPSLRHIDTKISHGALHFFPSFRDWNVMGSFCADLIALETLKQHCARQIGVANGELLVTSKGMFIYDSDMELVKSVRAELTALDGAERCD